LNKAVIARVGDARPDDRLQRAILYSRDVGDHPKDCGVLSDKT
jgi:hypothetical protein